MKYLTLLLLSSFLLASCTSTKKARETVEAEAKAERTDLTPSMQHQRAIALVKSSPDLSQEQKEKLTALIDKYVERATKRKQEQSQYRAVLVKEMLSEGKSKSLRVDAAKNSLLKIDRENSKDLEKFVNDFQFYAGGMAASHQSIMLQALDI